MSSPKGRRQHAISKDHVSKKARHNEYYGTTECFDELYKKAKEGGKFYDLYEIIISDENIMLAYRNIKANKGSTTPACDEMDIRDIKEISQEDFIKTVREKLEDYNPGLVRRVEIPKPNGKMRPLGIPPIWDRIIQQMFLQVLEPICEAHFSEHSYGFRPNRSAENAIAEVTRRINQQQLQYVVDIDIKGFFDEVNHNKLMSQLWTLGIRDKTVLAIIGKMLKAPIKMPDGEIVYPKKGVPQGGILSPLLSNVNLNEFDHWIESQWEKFDIEEVKPQKNKNGSENRCNIYKKLRESTELKEIHITRYADDFKIQCRTRKTAKRIYIAAEKWLKKRLKLPISEEKSKITNLKKHSSEFLGFSIKFKKKNWEKKEAEAKGFTGRKQIKAWKKAKAQRWEKNHKSRTRYVAETHILKKALKRIKEKLKEQINRIAHAKDLQDKIEQIRLYNSMIIGIHNYYNTATEISRDLSKIQFELMRRMYNRFPKAIEGKKKNPRGFTREGNYTGSDGGILPYLESKQMRYLHGYPILPIGYVSHSPPKHKLRAVEQYTEEGRNLIHRKLNPNFLNETAYIRNHPVKGRSVEYNDNRISLYPYQFGKCAVTKVPLSPADMECHHKELYSETADDSFHNLILIKPEVHKIIHATKSETILKYLEILKKDDVDIEDCIYRINKLREQIHLEKINLEILNTNNQIV